MGYLAMALSGSGKIGCSGKHAPVDNLGMETPQEAAERAKFDLVSRVNYFCRILLPALPQINCC